jgi:hypothetical protein
VATNACPPTHVSKLKFGNLIFPDFEEKKEEYNSIPKTKGFFKTDKQCSQLDGEHGNLSYRVMLNRGIDEKHKVWGRIHVLLVIYGHWFS